MSRLDDIEDAMAEIMLKIDGKTNSHGYTYVNTVTVVNIDDEPLTVTIGDFPTISITQDNDVYEGETVVDGSQSAYENRVRYKLVCSVENSPADITSRRRPKYAINRKMNSLLDDLKAVLGAHNNLNGTCEIVRITSSKRDYLEDGNHLRAGDLIVRLVVLYQQSRLNPDKNCTR